MTKYITITLTEDQALKLITVLVDTKTQAQLSIARDKRRANDGENSTINLADQLLLQLRKL